MNFCDYCECDDCKHGRKDLSHAQTSGGKWVCDVCYTYDLCTADGPNRNWAGPCKDKNCKHRPTIVGGWIKSDSNIACKDCGTNKLIEHHECVVCSTVNL